MRNKRTASDEGFLRSTVRRFMHHKIALVAMIILLLEVLAVILLAPILKLDPYSSHSGHFHEAPSSSFLLGTDEVGRDVFARLVYGGRVSLLVGFFSTVLSALIGVPLGLLAGYYTGALRQVIMRLVDVFMSFPSMVIQLVLVAVLGASTWSVVLVIGLLGWVSFTRLIYSKVISVKEQQYVEAARSNGAGNARIMFQYILPNSIAPILVRFSFGVAQAILIESGLSFIGLGVQVPTATWGNMMNAAQSLSVLVYRPWLWVSPGIMLIITVLAINFVGDGLRDALDPKMKI